MRKLLLSSITLLIFSVSILLFQISCQKTTLANNTNSNETIIYIKTVGNEINEIWTCNLDGTNNTKVTLIPPTGYKIYQVRLSPDGAKIITGCSNRSTGGSKIVSYNRDGTFLKTVVDTDLTSVGFEGYTLEGVN